MTHADFQIGTEFLRGNPPKRWRCTDVGSRTVLAICLSAHPDDASWFNGPPYAMVETVVDEYSMPDCTLAEPTAVILDWHGFRLRVERAEPGLPDKVQHAISYARLNPPLGWGNGEDSMNIMQVTFKRLNDGSKRYICRACPVCKPWEFSLEQRLR